MLRLASRTGRWPLALTIAALAACADEPSAPTAAPPSVPNAAVDYYFTVSNTNDHGIGSLRWVLSYADSGQTIRFDPALAGQTITVDSVIEMYLEDITIEGPRDRGITLSGGGKTRILETWGAGPYTLRNVALTGGAYETAPAILGGGVDVVLENSTVYGNVATNVNGGNSAMSLSKLTLINSTVSGNRSAKPTASLAIYATSKIVLVNSTVAHNASGGISPSSTLVLRNSILSDNEGRNCFGTTFTYEGVNLSDDDSCGGPTDIMIADPKLAPLGDNGGPTPTHALMVGSPAINAGSNCTVQADQRYAPRDEKCDLGAYEFADFTTVTLTIDAGAPVSQSNGYAIVSGTVACSRTETFSLAVQLVQQQKNGKNATTVDAANIVPVECSTTPRPWTASMVLTSGAFQSGTGTASAQVVHAEPWVTPASATSAVKLYWGRK